MIRSVIQDIRYGPKMSYVYMRIYSYGVPCVLQCAPIHTNVPYIPLGISTDLCKQFMYDSDNFGSSDQGKGK